MFGSVILEVAIGVIFIFALVSILCSAIREGIEAWLKTRAAYLEHGIRQLLHDANGKGLATSFYSHPLISSLFSGNYTPRKDGKRPHAVAKGGDLPTYIPSKNFAVALMDMAARGPSTDAASSSSESPVISLQGIRDNIATLNSPPVQRVLLTAIDSAQGDLNRAQANIEAWYDSAMDRVSGWYKRSTHAILFVIALAVAIGLNINAITIADYLYRNDGVRTALVARAEKAAADPASPNGTYEQARTDLDSLSLPIGWPPKSESSLRVADPSTQTGASYYIIPLLGWLITALAATMGAPFWFDVLNKVMVIRSTVKPHEKSPEEGSEDRKPSPPKTSDRAAGSPEASAERTGGGAGGTGG
jgi:hypothetical protein